MPVGRQLNPAEACAGETRGKRHDTRPFQHVARSRRSTFPTCRPHRLSRSRYTPPALISQRHNVLQCLPSRRSRHATRPPRDLRRDNAQWRRAHLPSHGKYPKWNGPRRQTGPQTRRDRRLHWQDPPWPSRRRQVSPHQVNLRECARTQEAI